MSDIEETELVFIEGPVKGKRFKVTSGCMTLGRSSSCEISVPDPTLSRQNTMFESRDGAIYVTDMASANGTMVNGVLLGENSVALKLGDEVTVGDSIIRLGDKVITPQEVLTSPQQQGPIDLGFKRQQSHDSADADLKDAKSSRIRTIIWGIALVAILGATAAILLAPQESEKEVKSLAAVKAPATKLYGVAYERVEADSKGIYRYRLDYSSKDDSLSVVIDSIPENERHVSKSVKLEGNDKDAFVKIFANKDIYKLEEHYESPTPRNDKVNVLSIKIIRSGEVFSTKVENTVEPSTFRELRESLEAFAQNELGITAIQYSTEKLLQLSAECERVGDEKWAERETKYGNTYEALKKYKEAMWYLETVEPKPDNYDALNEKVNKVDQELADHYKEQRFTIDKAINTSDWESARTELRILLEMIPDGKDERNQEANRKLLDVEKRISKGAAK